MMSRTITYFPVVLTIAWFCSDLSAQQQQSNELFAEILKSENQDISEEAVDEILAIRKRIGGIGLPSQEFSAKASQPGSAPIADQKPAQLQADTNSGRNPKWKDLQFKADSKAVSPLKSGTKKIRIRQLRAVARKMDTLAADLEDLDLFQDADTLRARAASIRGEARRSAMSPVYRR